MSEEKEHGTITETDLSCAIWRTSTFSGGNGSCVEVATNLRGLVLVRDSKDREGEHLLVSSEEWRGFLRILRRPA